MILCLNLKEVEDHGSKEERGKRVGKGNLEYTIFEDFTLNSIRCHDGFSRRTYKESYGVVHLLVSSLMLRGHPCFCYYSLVQSFGANFSF